MTKTEIEQINKGIWYWDDKFKFEEIVPKISDLISIDSSYKYLGINLNNTKGDFVPSDDESINNIINQCHSQGIKIFGWLFTFLNPQKSNRFPSKDIKGKLLSEFICPSNEGYLKDFKESLGNILNYDLDLIILTACRFYNYKTCFCDNCMRKLQERNIHLRHEGESFVFNEDFLKWIDWKAETICDFVKEAKSAIKEKRGDISLAVKMFFETSKDGFWGSKVCFGEDIYLMSKIVDNIVIDFLPFTQYSVVDIREILSIFYYEVEKLKQSLSEASLEFPHFSLYFSGIDTEEEYKIAMDVGKFIKKDVIILSTNIDKFIDMVRWSKSK